MSRKPLAEESAWKKLSELYQTVGKQLNLRELFSQDAQRFAKYSHKLQTPHDGELLFDFSKNLLNEQVLAALFELARERGVEENRDRMFKGERINFTENRSVLHIALRNRSNRPIVLNGVNIMSEVNKVLDKMRVFCDSVRSGEWKGYTSKSITDVINIGIGGSDLGKSKK